VYPLWPFELPSISQLRADPDRALKHRVVFVVGEIEAVGTHATIAKLLFLNSESQSLIHLLIDSVGGDVAAGLAVIDTFSHITAPVSTHCLECAFGMAAMILAAGKRGRRSASANARLALVPCDAPDETDPKEMQRVESILIELLQRSTGQPNQVLAADLRSSKHFSADEAAAYGLIDSVANWNLERR
jgi:ATP-dependent Clp protease protease subunit